MCVSSFLRHLKGQREKNKIPNLLHKRSPTESLFFSLFPFTPPRGTGRNLPTHRSIGPRPIFHFPFTPPRGAEQKVPDILPNLSPTDFPFLHHIVVHFVSLFFFYTTSWHRAEVTTHCSISPRAISFFLTPLNGTEQKSSMHYSSGPHNSQNQTLKGTLFWRAQWNKLLTTCSHHEQE